MPELLLFKPKKAPTKAKITEHFSIDRWEVVYVWGLLRGRINPTEVDDLNHINGCPVQVFMGHLWTLKTYEQWARVVMFAIHILLNKYGVEDIFGEGPEGRKDAYFSYINVGDTYNPTIVHDQEKRKFTLTCVGDFVEDMEKRGWKFP